MIFWHTVENLEALSLLKVGTRQMVGKRHTITVDRSSCQLFCTIFELRSIIFDQEKKTKKNEGPNMICDDNNKAAQNFCLAHFHFSSFCSLQKSKREVQKGFKKQSIKVYSKLVFWWWKKFCVSAQKKKMRNCITVVALKSWELLEIGKQLFDRFLEYV